MRSRMFGRAMAGLLSLGTFGLFSQDLSAQDVAITNARVIVGNGTVIDSGTVIVRGGKIVAVAAGGANTQGLMVYVDDVDAHCERARAAGARVVSEPEVHDYGVEYWADRSYGAIDPEGHLWWFSQRLRTGGEDEPVALAAAAAP